MPQIKMCIDMHLPPWMRREAREIAVRENRDNATRAALPNKTKWANGRVLRVRFLDGHASVQARVREMAMEWTEHANLQFVFGDDPDAEIRVSFSADKDSWSFIGTDNLLIAKHRPTMNFGWLTPNSSETEFSRVVKHEFGHAIGLIHEHQSPAANIPWDREAVYAHYTEGQDWTRADVDVNLFATYAASSTQFSAYDKTSIMHYPVDNDLTLGDYSVGWNTKLSDTDKSFIKTAYPSETPVAKKLEVNGPTLSAAISSHGERDLYVFVVTKKGVYAVETTGGTDVFLSLHANSGGLIAEDDDSGAGLNPRVVATLNKGAYAVVVRHYQPKGTGTYKIAVKAL